MRLEVSKVASERKPRKGGDQKQDTIDRDTLRALFGYTEAQINLDPEIAALFEEAVREKWQGETGKAIFQNRLQQTQWWQSNSESMRDYLFRKANPDADWRQLTADSEEAVRQEAMAMGVELTPEEVRSLTERSMMYGWYKPEKKFELRRAMGGTETGSGDIAGVANSLRELSYEMGINFNDEWYASAGKSVASKLTTADFWGNKIRERAAAQFPMFSDQIKAGQSVRNVASPYITMMSDEWEMPEQQISITNPTILRAIGGNGGNQMMNLSDFQRTLRRDPRWMNTNKAQNEITGVASAVMQMFGLRG